MVDPLASPGLCVALALCVGVATQSVAVRLRVPGIVLLLAVGTILGPDVLNVLRPETLGDTLHALVGFAVAVILFEGGLSLNMRRLLRERAAIRRIIAIGGLLTIIGATALARWVLDWDWRPSILFGVLMMVTGPTVVQPLLRRMRVERSVATILSAEGVLIDAIGAITASVALEAAISPTVHVGEWVFATGARLGFGVFAGGLVGALIALALRHQKIAEGMHNIFTLASVLVLYQASNALFEESGVAAVTAAGLALGNMSERVPRELVEFKEQLTIMLIGMLFVLLAADVRVAEIQALGWPAVAVVVLLAVVVRPIAIFAATAGGELSWQQRTLVGWVGPRGIVAAAVASLFAEVLTSHGLPGGPQLRALVFMVIGGTVVLAGLTGGTVARWLGLQRPEREGWVILGANPVACAVGKLLQDSGSSVVVIDSNPLACREAESMGLRVVYGNALEDRALQQAALETRVGAVAMTSNEEVNLLFAAKAKQQARVRKALVMRERTNHGVTDAMLADAQVGILFGREYDVSQWSLHIRHKDAALEYWQASAGATAPHAWRSDLSLPLLLHRHTGGASAESGTAGGHGATLRSEFGSDSPHQTLGKSGETDVERALAHDTNHARGPAIPYEAEALAATPLADGDEVAFLINTTAPEQARAELREAGWRPSARPA